MTATEPSFLLDAESLVSKWGFGDGDALDDWWWDTFDVEPPVNCDDLLHALVLEYLVPAMRARGWDPKVIRIGTIHNPVRAESLNGHEVDWYASGHVHFDPPIEVSVTWQQIEQLAAQLIIREAGSNAKHDRGASG